uniref:Uncharacterized protein n=1 Tax=Avena sativa TaxID=4498 RepID=A0ACD5TS38_AVESA
MVSWLEHANSISLHGLPQDNDVFLDSSRKGNLISGPCLLHLDGGQYLKKSLSSHAVAKSTPWLTRHRRTATTRNLLILLYCMGLLMKEEWGEGKQAAASLKKQH